MAAAALDRRPVKIHPAMRAAPDVTQTSRWPRPIAGIKTSKRVDEGVELGVVIDRGLVCHSDANCPLGQGAPHQPRDESPERIAVPDGPSLEQIKRPDIRPDLLNPAVLSPERNSSSLFLVAAGTVHLGEPLIDAIRATVAVARQPRQTILDVLRCTRIAAAVGESVEYDVGRPSIARVAQHTGHQADLRHQQAHSPEATGARRRCGPHEDPGLEFFEAENEPSRASSAPPTSTRTRSTARSALKASGTRKLLRGAHVTAHVIWIDLTRQRSREYLLCSIV